MKHAHVSHAGYYEEYIGRAGLARLKVRSFTNEHAWPGATAQ